MTLISIILVLIGLLVGWYIGRSYYKHSSKLFTLIFIILISFAAAWLALKYAQDSLRNIKTSSALWTGFIISSIIAFISLLNGGHTGCTDKNCGCASGKACGVKTSAASSTTSAKAFTGKADDLKVVEGIGPVIEKHLNSNDVWTYEQLADSDPIHLKNILDRAGDRLAVHDPSTRPTQAAFARDNNLTELVAFQETLKAGRA